MLLVPNSEEDHALSAQKARCVCERQVASVVSDSATLWTAFPQALLSMGFLRQEYWSGLPFPPPGDLPNPGIKPISLAAPTFAGGFFPIVPPGKSLEMNSGYFWVLLVFTSSDYLEFYLGILKLLSDDKFLEVGLLGQRI